MASIHTQINAATMTSHEVERLHRLICRHAIDPARTTIGVSHDGYLMLLVGWSVYRHPRQWRRAHEMIAASFKQLTPFSARAQSNAGFLASTRTMRLDQSHVLVWLLRNATASVKDRMLQGIKRQLSWRGNDSLCTVDIAERCLPRDAPSELRLRMGSAQSATGLYKLLTDRSSPYRDHFHRELSTSRDRSLWVARQTVLRARNGALLPANAIYVGDRLVAVACQAPLPADVERHLEMLMTLRPAVVVHVGAQATPCGLAPTDGGTPRVNRTGHATRDWRTRESREQSRVQIQVDTQHVATSAAATCMTDFSIYASILRSTSREVAFAVLHAPYRHKPEVTTDKLYVTQTLQFIEDATRHVPPHAKPCGKAEYPVSGCPVIVFDDIQGIAGVLIAAIALYAESPGQSQPVSVEEVITDIRLTGSPQLIGTAHQIDVISAFADDLRLPLLKNR